MLLESFSTFLIHKGVLTSCLSSMSSAWWIFYLSGAPNFLENHEGSLCIAYSCPKHLHLSHPVCQPSFLNREKKMLASSRGCPATLTGRLLAGCIFMIFVLPLLMWRPILADVEYRHVVLFCICAWLWDKSARSTAKLRISSCDPVSTVCQVYLCF